MSLIEFIPPPRPDSLMKPRLNSLSLDLYLDLHQISHTHKYQSSKYPRLFSSRFMESMKISHNVKESENKTSRSHNSSLFVCDLPTTHTQINTDENTTFLVEETKGLDEPDSSLCEANSSVSVVSGNKTQTDENTVSYKDENNCYNFSEAAFLDAVFMVSSWCLHGVFMVSSWCLHGVGRPCRWCGLRLHQPLPSPRGPGKLLRSKRTVIVKNKCFHKWKDKSNIWCPSLDTCCYAVMVLFALHEVISLFNNYLHWVVSLSLW